MSSKKTIAWAIWMIASIFYAYQYILRVMPNIMLDDIMQQFQISPAVFGQFSGVYYMGYSLMHLPIGIMLDRYGPRKVMTCCILSTVIGLTPLIFSDHWVYPILGRLLIGMGSTGAILGLFKIIRMTFSEEKFPRMLSLSVMIGLIGAIYGGAPVSLMSNSFGYQMVVKCFALSGIVLALLTYLIIPEDKNCSKESVLSNIKEVLTNRKVISFCVFSGLMLGPLEGFADVWGTTFLKQVYKFDGTTAASLPSMIFIGMCFGSPLLNFIAEKTKNYTMTIVASGIVMTAVFSFLLFLKISPEVLTINFLMVGVCSAYQILAIYKASTFVNENVAGITTAVANMIIMIFGYIFHTLMGAVINMMGGANDPKALELGVAIIPIGLFLGTSGFILLMGYEKATKHLKKS